MTLWQNRINCEANDPSDQFQRVWVALSDFLLHKMSRCLRNCFLRAGCGLICMQPPTRLPIWQSWLGTSREMQLSTMPTRCGCVHGQGAGSSEQGAAGRRVVRASLLLPMLAHFLATNLSCRQRAVGQQPLAAATHPTAAWLLPNALSDAPLSRRALSSSAFPAICSIGATFVVCRLIL